MIKIGIAGYGKIGQLRAKILLERNDIKLVGIYDLEKPKKIDSITFYNSYDDLLNSDLDAVFICAYNTVLAEYTSKALNRGLHVFCEKPPARKVSELLQVKKAYAKSKSILKYGFNHRYHYSVVEAKRKIESGNFGKIIWMRGIYGKAGSIDYHKNWRNYKNISGGGILIDQGIHMVDLIQYLSDRNYEEIKSFISTSYWDIEAEDNAFAIMRSEDDVLVSIHSSATQWKHKFLLEICLEEGFINLDGILSGTRSYSPEKLIFGRREFEDITHAMGKPRENVIWFEYDDSWRLEVEEFISAIESKSKSKIINGTIDDAIKTLKIVEKIYKSK